MRILIVDDELLAREMLAAFLARLGGYTLVGMARNTQEAKEFLVRDQIDLMLLDIEMPRGRGTDLLRQLKQPPMIIFTTAYKSYALEGYNFDPIDYLLKPINFSRFETALQKAKARFNTTKKALAYDESTNDPTQFLTVREGHTTKKLALGCISHVSAMREYVCYHTPDGRTMELKSISKVSTALASLGFVRIHRSYLVAKTAVQSFDAAQVTLFSGQTLPIGKTFRKKALQDLG